MCNRFSCFSVLQRFWIAIASGFIAVRFRPRRGAATDDRRHHQERHDRGRSLHHDADFGLVGRTANPRATIRMSRGLWPNISACKVEFVPVTGANRIPQLMSGRVDVLICLFGITAERALQVWYSMPYAYEAASSSRLPPSM